MMKPPTGWRKVICLHCSINNNLTLNVTKIKELTVESRRNNGFNVSPMEITSSFIFMGVQLSDFLFDF